MNLYLQNIEVVYHVKMSEDARDGPFHSKTHTFDPIQYIKDYYSGSYPCVYDQELFELLCNKIHKLFADGKKCLIVSN